MFSPAVRSSILVSAVLAMAMSLPRPALAQEEAPSSEPSPPIEGQISALASSAFDSGQETPAAPITPAPGPSTYAESLISSQFLFGDAFGLRPLLEQGGFSFYASSTQFEQGVASGGAQQAFRWGAKFDMLAHLDSEKLGLWQGGALDVFAESRLGQSIDGFAASYSPTNLAMFFPVPNQDITAITGLKYTQQFTETTGLFFGKLNALNGDLDRFLKYPLTSRFLNAAFNFNLALDRYPYSTPGAGFYTDLKPGPSLALLVLNTYNSPRTSGLENLGKNGMFIYAQAKQATNFFGLPGQHALGGLFGTGSFTDLAPASFIELPSPAGRVPRKTGTWTLLWNFEQRLLVDPENPNRGLGLYGQTGLGDGNPNPVRWFFSIALCGNSPLPGRDGDILGVGFYDLGLSSQFKSLAAGLRDETGVELFYNARIAPGCHLSPDIQILHPGLAPVATAFVLGLRLKLDF